MSIRRFFSPTRSSATDQHSILSDRPPTYASNVTAAPSYAGNRIQRYGARGDTTASVISQDSEAQTRYSLADTVSAVETAVEAATSGSTDPRYLYYRVYAKDGAIILKKPATRSNPFLGRVKASSVAPPHTVASVARCIARSEGVRSDGELFLSPSSQSPMDNGGKVDILGPTSGPGYIPEEPLALVVDPLSSYENRYQKGSKLENIFGYGRMSRNSRYLYYRLFNSSGDIPSKVPINPQEPSLGRIRADDVAPPHTPTSIKKCIARVEKNLSMSSARLFADISHDTPMEEGPISILSGDCPGLSQNKPMALVQR